MSRRRLDALDRPAEESQAREVVAARGTCQEGEDRLTRFAPLARFKKSQGVLICLAARLPRSRFQFGVKLMQLNLAGDPDDAGAAEPAGCEFLAQPLARRTRD